MLWRTVSSSRKTALALPDLARRAPWTQTIRWKVALAIAGSNWPDNSLQGQNSGVQELAAATDTRNSNIPLSNQTNELRTELWMFHCSKAQHIQLV